jgi:hypothetical protein
VITFAPLERFGELDRPSTFLAEFIEVLDAALGDH